MTSGRHHRIENYFAQGPGPNEKVWTRAEILSMWPQAEGELRGFQRHLETGSGITASQLGMALQLARAEFDRIRLGHV